MGSDGGSQRGEIEAGNEKEREDVGRALENTEKSNAKGKKTGPCGQGLSWSVRVCVFESKREKEEQKEFGGGIKAVQFSSSGSQGLTSLSAHSSSTAARASFLQNHELLRTPGLSHLLHPLCARLPGCQYVWWGRWARHQNLIRLCDVLPFSP